MRSLAVSSTQEGAFCSTSVHLVELQCVACSLLPPSRSGAQNVKTVGVGVGNELGLGLVRGLGLGVEVGDEIGAGVGVGKRARSESELDL